MRRPFCGAETSCILPPCRCVPDRHIRQRTLSYRIDRGPGAASGRSVGVAPRPGTRLRTAAPGGESDVHRSNTHLRRLWRRLRALGRGPGVLRHKGLRLGSEALPELPSRPAIDEGSRRRTGGRQGAQVADLGNTSPPSARAAATRLRSRSSHTWTGPSTAPTASESSTLRARNQGPRPGVGPGAWRSGIPRKKKRRSPSGDRRFRYGRIRPWSACRRRPTPCRRRRP